jgi:hypothetical protein
MGAMRLLDGPGAEKTIKALLAGATRARIAVAYWGEGAVERLGIDTMSIGDVEVVCDVVSGGCNPLEVERLRKVLGSDRVMTCDRLHAKVWVTDLGVVIGSSNASANGLGYESAEAAGLIEANLFIDDPTTVAIIERWFEQLVKPGSRPVTDEDLRRAQPLWKRRRKARPRPVGASVLDALRANPVAFAERDFLVWVYPHGNRSPLAEKQLDTAQRERHDSSIDCWENEDAPPGAYILDFHLQRNGKAKFDGLWQVLSDDPKQQSILLCRPAEDVEGMPIGNKATWEAAATRAVESGKDAWDITEFNQFLPVKK